MPKLTIVANIKAKADKIDLVRTELEKLIDITRSEAGCQQYDLHQDNDDPTHFMFYENWDSRELWQTHMNAQHLKDYMAATDGAGRGFHAQRDDPNRLNGRPERSDRWRCSSFANTRSATDRWPRGWS